MVNSAARKLEKELIDIVEVPKDDINWSSVSLSDVLDKGKRIEASVYDVECKHARDLVKKSIYGYDEINIDKDLIDCYTRPRFKRIWLDKSVYTLRKGGFCNEEDLFSAYSAVARMHGCICWWFFNRKSKLCVKNFKWENFFS